MDKLLNMQIIKKFMLAALLFSALQVAAQSNTYYVAAKTGLSIREKPAANAKVLDKIPYGARISLLEDSGEWVEIKTEGLTGHWRKVKYNNHTGYIVGSYLFTSPPPTVTIKDMRAYFAQISTPFGSKLVVKSGVLQNVEEGGWELHKQLYKNGAEWHKTIGYEYHSDTYFLPGFTMEQAFLLVRMIPEFKEVFGEKEEYPTTGKMYKKGEREYKIVVDKEEYEGGFSWIKKISVEFEDGAIYDFEMFQTDNQVVIIFGSGV
jgi:hypothetical protein